MRIEIDHSLTLSIPPGTGQAVMQVLLTPRSGPGQTVREWNVDMPGIDNAAHFTDAFGNAMLLVNIAKPETEISLHVTGVVETTDLAGVLGRPPGEPVPALYKRVTAEAKASEEIVARFVESGDSRLSILHGLMAAVGAEFGIESEASAEQTQMQADGGAVQTQSSGEIKEVDAAALAHCFVGACRALDIPARVVTGYLRDAPLGVSPFHVWAEAYEEGLGWIGFDPAIQLCPTDRHVRLAVGLDADSARPLRTVPAGEISQTVVVR